MEGDSVVGWWRDYKILNGKGITVRYDNGANNVIKMGLFDGHMIDSELKVKYQVKNMQT